MTHSRQTICKEVSLQILNDTHSLQNSVINETIALSPLSLEIENTLLHNEHITYIFQGCTFHQDLIVQGILSCHSLTFIDCEFQGLVDISQVTLSGSLSFHQCHFLHQQKSVNGRFATIKQDLIFSECHFRSLLDGYRSSIINNLYIKNCRFLKPINSKNMSLDFSRAKISGDLVMEKTGRIDTRTTVATYDIQGHVSYERLHIEGNCLLQSVVAKHTLLMKHCTIEGSLNILDAHFTEIHLTSASIMQSVHLQDSRVKHLNIDKILITQNLSLQDCNFGDSHKAYKPSAISAYQCHIAGDMLLSQLILYQAFSLNISKIQGQCSIKKSQFFAVLDISGSSFSSVVLYKINISQDFNGKNIKVFNTIEIAGGKNHIAGNVLLSSANIDDSLKVEYLQTEKKFDLENTTIRGKLYFSPFIHSLSNHGLPCFIYSEVNSLDLSTARISAVVLHGITIKYRLQIFTGIFNQIRICAGLHLDGNTYRYKVSKIGVVDIKAIEVKESFKCAHLEVGLDIKHQYDELDHSLSRFGFHLTHSKIHSYLQLFPVDFYRDIWRYYTSRHFSVIAEQQTDSTIFNKLLASARPKDSFYNLIYGNLMLRANTVGGSIDIRNTKVDIIKAAKGAYYPIGGKISLSDTKVTRHVHAGSRYLFDESLPNGYKRKKLATECYFFEIDDLQSGDDIEIYGLKITRPEVEDSLEDLNLRMIATGLKCSGNLEFIQPYFYQNQDASLPKAYIESGTMLLDNIDVHTLRIGRNIFSTPSAEGHISLAQANIKNFIIHSDDRHTELKRKKQTYSLLGMNAKAWTFKGWCYTRDSLFAATSLDGSNTKTSQDFINDKYRHSSRAKDFLNVLQNTKSYEQNSWYEVERYLRNVGRNNSGDTIHRSMRKDYLRKEVLRNSPLKYILRHIIEWPTSYGTRLTRPLFIFLVPTFVVSAFIFSNPDNVTLTFDAMESYGGYEAFYLDNKNPITDKHHKLSSPKEILNYSNLCYTDAEQDTRFKVRFISTDIKVPHPLCEGNWTLTDGIEMALTYHIPMINYIVETSWEARSEPMKKDFCLMAWPLLRQKDETGHQLKDNQCIYAMSSYLTPGHYTFFASLLSWIILPIYFYGVTTRLLRGRNI